MNFNSQICTTREQSKQLLALGLKKATADMFYTNASMLFEKDKFHLECKEYIQLDKEVNYQICPFTFIPAWSLHRLLCLLPTEYIADIDFQSIMQDFIFMSQNMYDEVISCIEILIKEGYFYKEYLEE